MFINEYLQYLYMRCGTDCVSGISLEPLFEKMIREGVKKARCMAMAFAAICYCTQAVVNISVPMVTPIMLLMIMNGDGDYEKKKK